MPDEPNELSARTALRAMLLIHVHLVRRLMANGVIERDEVIADLNRMQVEGAAAHSSVPELSSMLTYATMMLGEMLGDRPASSAS